MKSIIRKINSLYDRASDLAVEAVKKGAREILKNDPDLHEFIMAMGGCFFTIKKGGKYDGLSMTDEEFDAWCESDEYVREYQGIIDDDDFQADFFDIVSDLDEKFNVCGYPVRFTATSKEVYEWGDTTKNPVKYEEGKIK